MTRHPGHVWRDDSQGYDQWVAECPRCGWQANPTAVLGLARQWLREHREQQQQREGER